MERWTSITTQEITKNENREWSFVEISKCGRFRFGLRIGSTDQVLHDTKNKKNYRITNGHVQRDQLVKQIKSRASDVNKPNT